MEKTVSSYGLSPGEWETLPTKECLRLLDSKKHSVGVVAIPKSASLFEAVNATREAILEAKTYIERYRYA